MRNILNTTATGLRFVGDLANIAAFAGFVWAAFTLKGMAVDRIDRAGGLDAITPDAVSHAFSALIQTDKPQETAALVASPYIDLGMAWLLIVACGGCIWMSMLGARWGYHYLLRLLNR